MSRREWRCCICCWVGKNNLMAIHLPNLFQSPRLAGARMASVYFLIAIAYIAAPLLWMMSNKSEDRLTDVMRISVPYVISFSLLAWGCLHLNKFAYWISFILLGIDSFLFLMVFPGELKFIFKTVREIANMNGPINFQSAFPPVAFYCVVFVAGVLKTVALVCLLLRSTREAFGIGKSASHKIDSHAFN